MPRTRTSTRRRFIAGSAGLAGAAAGAAAGAELFSGTTASDSGDAAPLALALALERLQEAFYAEAVAAGGLSGELLDFAVTASLHEAEHVALLTPLVAEPPAPAAYDFGADTAGPVAFARAAIAIGGADPAAAAADRGLSPARAVDRLGATGYIAGAAP